MRNSLICFRVVLLWFDSLMMIPWEPQHVRMFNVILWYKHVRNSTVHFFGLGVVNWCCKIFRKATLLYCDRRQTRPKHQSRLSPRVTTLWLFIQHTVGTLRDARSSPPHIPWGKGQETLLKCRKYDANSPSVDVFNLLKPSGNFTYHQV
jgi:hypothetical protein